MLENGVVHFNLFLNRKLSVREEFQFKIINLSHQVGQIEQFYEDGNCFRICLFIKGLFFSCIVLLVLENMIYTCAE